MSVRSEALVREERRDTGSAFDFLTEPFKAVRRPQASSVSGSHAGVGEGPGNGRLDPNFSNVWQTPLRGGMGDPFHPRCPRGGESLPGDQPQENLPLESSETKMLSIAICPLK